MSNELNNLDVTSLIDEKQLGTIKKANQSEMISKEEFELRTKAIYKSKNDIVWWANHFFRILTLDNGLQTIKCFPKQAELLRCMVENNRVITLASRQTSKTTSYTIFALWYTTLFKDKSVMICANKKDTALEVMGRIRTAYMHLPTWIKPGTGDDWAKGKIKFSNGSVIGSFATSSDSARGFSANCIFLDEFAFVPKNVADNFFASVMPTISSGKNSKAIIVSTPNGAQGLYYDLWQQANAKDSSKNVQKWTPFRFYWHDFPGHDEKWKELQIATVGQERWRQEFECEFLTSQSKKLIPDDILAKYRMELEQDKIKGIKPKKQKIISQDQTELFEFDMWHEFNPQRAYLASSDIAEGVGGDSSVLYIWDVTDLSKITMCAKFSSSTVSVVQFAYITNKILQLYGNPYLAAERNGISGGMLDSLRITYGYQNIAKENKKNEPGIYSHTTVKEKACLWCREMFTTAGFGFKIYDKTLIDEFEIFVKKDNKGMHNIFQAIQGPDSHDDHVMTFIWMTYILQNEIIQKYFNVISTFNTELGIEYPKQLQPLDGYTADMIQKISNDPLYKEFISFKNEISTKLSKAIELENIENQNDMFKYENDPYFGDNDGQSWNTMSKQTINLNNNYGGQTLPFFII